jgi:tellurite resistance protein TerC
MAAALIGYALVEWRGMRTDHVINLRDATRWSLIYIGLALLFGVLIFATISPQAGGEYLAAWAIEKALSLDNLFVIGIIFASFKIPPQLQRRMLNYGIIGAIVFRLLFILAGFELLKRFEWVSIIFGLILLRAAWDAFREAHGSHKDEEKPVTEQFIWRLMMRILPIHPKLDGHKLTTIHNGKRVLTLMAAVIIVIEFTDVVFAVDSVPAVLAVSPDRFIAYSSNIFALLGLRALFFVYQAVVERFWALNWTLAAVLAWISFKMIVAPLGLHIPVSISLGVLALLLGGGVGISLAWPRHPDTAA